MRQKSFNENKQIILKTLRKQQDLVYQAEERFDLNRMKLKVEPSLKIEDLATY